ncbi:unnamed protein product [Brassica oleracea]
MKTAQKNILESSDRAVERMRQGNNINASHVKTSPYRDDFFIFHEGLAM